MLLHFGPLRCTLEGPADWLELARARYDGFVSEDAAEGAIEPADAIRVVYRTNGRLPSPGLVDETLPRSPRLRPSVDAGSDGAGSEAVWHFRSPGVEGRLAPGRIEITGPLATYPLDAALIAQWALAGRDAVVVHGALLADGDRGWLCTGPSGVGKTTLAALLPEHARCDELVGLRRETRAEFPELVAYSLPFWRGRPSRVVLDGVHFLRHEREHRRRPLSPARAFARLRTQVLWPNGPAATLAGAFRTVTALAELPCHVLGFRPDRGVWHHVRREAAYSAPTGAAA